MPPGTTHTGRFYDALSVTSGPVLAGAERSCRPEHVSGQRNWPGSGPRPRDASVRATAGASSAGLACHELLSSG
jgi:hypothetical protein